MAFLDKLKGKMETENLKEEPKKIEEKKPKSEYAQLDIDIYETSQEFVIYAPVAGAEIKDLDITIENENDVVTIKGKKEMPIIDGTTEKDRKYLRQECSWGSFYRQIILPQEIDVSKIEAKLVKGVLILRLPILRLPTKGKKKIEIKG